MKILNIVKVSFFALLVVLATKGFFTKVSAQEIVVDYISEEVVTAEETTVSEEVVVEDVVAAEEATISEEVVVEEVVTAEAQVVLEVADEAVVFEDSRAVDVVAACDESTPVITVTEDYYEYTYGINVLEILGDLSINQVVVDPNGDPFVQTAGFVNNLVGGLYPHVGVYTYRYSATDINGCVGTKDITIVINPVPDLICDANNRPVITILNDIIRYPDGASLPQVLGNFGNFYTVIDPNSPADYLKSHKSYFVNDLVGGFSSLQNGDYVYHLIIMDEEGCTDEKEFTVRIGPDPSNNDGGNGGGNNNNGGEQVSFGSSGGGNGGGNGEGRVLGATTSCAPYITKYMKYKGNNDSKEVTKLQIFLNEKLGMNLNMDGVFGRNTLEGVRKFQLANAQAVLKPWGIQQPTEYVYLTTTHAINMAMCPELNIPAPTNLVPFSQYQQ